MLKKLLLLSPLALLALGRAPEVREAHADHIEMAFCYISNDWSKPNTTIYAQTRAEADKKGKEKKLVFCKRGPCDLEGELRPDGESCER